METAGAEDAGRQKKELKTIVISIKGLLPAAI